MLFDKEEIGLINRSIIRKTSEVARAFMERRFSPTVRNRLGCSIGRNIVRLRSLYNLGNNDFSDVEYDYKILASEDHFIPLNCYDKYDMLLSESNKEDEIQLRALDALVWDFLPLLHKSMELSDLIKKGYNPVIDSDLNTYVHMKSFFLSCKRKYIIPDFEDCVPYSDSNKYLDYMILHCSLMIRIGTYKNITNEEISNLINMSYEIDSEPFEALCLIEMNDVERRSYLTFKNLEEERLSIALAKAINNSFLELK